MSKALVVEKTEETDMDIKKVKIIVCLLALLIIGLLIFLLTDSEEDIKVELVNIGKSTQADSADISSTGMTFAFKYSQTVDDENGNPRFEIVSVEAVGDKKDKHFGGNITCWIREPNKLEYIINGDIFLNKNFKSEIKNIVDGNRVGYVFLLEPKKSKKDGEKLKSKQYVYIHETKELESNISNAYTN